LIAGSDGFDVKDVRASGANAVSIKLTSDDNLVRCNSVSGSPLGVRIEGKGNDVRDGTVSGITGKGVEIGPTGSNNQFRKATVRQNSGAGIVVEGTGNTLGGNRVNGNIANDTHIKAAAAGTNLKGNQSGSCEIGGAEQRVDTNAFDLGGNRADGVSIPSAQKRPTFVAAGSANSSSVERQEAAGVVDSADLRRWSARRHRQPAGGQRRRCEGFPA